MRIWGSSRAATGSKVFVRQVGDRSFSYADFRIPVYHKRKRKYIQRKDIGASMSVPLIASSLPLYDQPSPQALDVLDRYRGMDEESGSVYRYLYHTHDDSIEHINRIWGTSLSQEAISGIPTIVGYTGFDGFVSDELYGALSSLYILQLLWGKWEERGETLHGIKITLPLIVSTMQFQSQILTRVDSLRGYDIIIKVDVIEQPDGATIQIASSDICLLDQFVLWHKPLATWSVISTKDFTDSLVSGLRDFVGNERGELPADALIKIASVQK